MDEFAVKVWYFTDAPAEFRALSPHGGDEDWLAVLPASYEGGLPVWMEDGTPFGVSGVSRHALPDGRMVVIGCHS